MQDRFDDDRRSNSGLSSPYLNFDPSILNPSGSSQFIIPEGQGETRGKMEVAFFTIGSALTVGGLFGGVNGLLQGIKETKTMPKNVRFTQIINFIGKRSSVSAQTLGSLALMYSLYDTLLSNTRGIDDELNTVASGVLTGFTIRSPYGLRAMAKGGIFGLAVALTFVSYNHQDFLRSTLKLNNKNS